MFLEYSYEKVSTSLLEKKIGLTCGAIFYYAKNKNQLFRDVINKYVLEKQDVKYKMSSVNIEVYPVLPLKVEYYLTDAGKELIPILDKLREWGDKHKEEFISKTTDKSEE